MKLKFEKFNHPFPILPRGLGWSYRLLPLSEEEFLANAPIGAINGISFITKKAAYFFTWRQS